MEASDHWDFEVRYKAADADWQKFLSTLRKNGDSRIRGFFHKKNPKKQGGLLGPSATLDRDIIERWQFKGYGVYVVIGNGGDTNDSEITDVPALLHRVG